MSRLSIDFGTSNTVAALSRSDDRVRTLLFDGSPTLPSAVFLDPSGVLLVGRDAAHAARTAPDRYEPNPKRRIDEGTVLLGDTELPVVDLIAAVLRLVADEAGRVAGGPVPEVTLTHPAAWAQTRRQLLVHAAERAGLPPARLVPEPVAAAYTFLAVSGGAVPVGGSVVVYDLGAGTFDASVVRRGPDGFDVVAAEGLSQAGGLDIDAAIVGYLGAMDAARHADAWTRLLNPRTAAERRANRLLWEDVRTAKEVLSRAGGTQVHVPLVDVDVPLSREQFEYLARPILDATITATRAALNSARVETGDVAGVFLVGGGSRIPLVATLLQRMFGRAPTITEQPELAVAEGGLHAGGGPVGFDRPVSAQPFASGPPLSGPPVSGPPVSGPPVSGPPVSPVSGAGLPDGGASPRSRRRLLIAAAAVVLLLLLGIGAAVVLLPRDGTVDVNHTLLNENGRRITLVEVKVGSGTLRVNLRYDNNSSGEWGLTCASAEDDLRSSYLSWNGGANTVYPTETWCSANAPGQNVVIKAGERGSSYAIFPSAPPEGTTFSLTWYSWTADGLRL